MLPAGKSTGQHLWVKQKMPIRRTRAETGWKHPLDWAPKAMNYVMVIGLSCSTLVLGK